MQMTSAKVCLFVVGDFGAHQDDSSSQEKEQTATTEALTRPVENAPASYSSASEWS
jgi:hypothetical protein